jgi:hypothetical protein
VSQAKDKALVYVLGFFVRDLRSIQLVNDPLSPLGNYVELELQAN